MHTQSLNLVDSNGNTIWSLSSDECESDVIALESGQSYRLEFSSSSTDIDPSVEVILSAHIECISASNPRGKRQCPPKDRV